MQREHVCFVLPIKRQTPLPCSASRHLLPPTPAVVTPPHTFPASAGLLLVAVAQPPPVLLIPRAQRLAAKRQVVVLDDGGLHPPVRGSVHLAGR